MFTSQKLCFKFIIFLNGSFSKNQNTDDVQFENVKKLSYVAFQPRVAETITKLCLQISMAIIKAGVSGRTQKLNRLEGSHGTLAPEVKTQRVAPIREQRSLGGVYIKESSSIISNVSQLLTNIFAPGKVLANGYFAKHIWQDFLLSFFSERYFSHLRGIKVQVRGMERQTVNSIHNSGSSLMSRLIDILVFFIVNTKISVSISAENTINTCSFVILYNYLISLTRKHLAVITRPNLECIKK